jgi:hypothetical protein
MKRRLLVLGTVGALVLSLWAAAPAQAAGNSSCAISGQAQFTPGLKTANQAVSYTFTGKASGCVSSDKTVKNGSISASGSGAKVACSGGKTAGSGAIAWNNGQSSGFSFTTSGAGALVSVSGQVTSGEFAGSKITAVLAFTANAAQCASTGVSTASFTGASRVG